MADGIMDPNDWDWYVGDPCYHIPDERWSEFCDLLWAAEAKIREGIREADPERWEYVDENGDLKQRYIPIHHEVIIDWPVGDYLDERDTVAIEVWSSPYGDGIWQFKRSDLSAFVGVVGLCNHVKGEEIPVDAGIIAIVPREAVKENEDDLMGIYFKGDRPTLETYEGDFEVRLNGSTHDGIEQCYECGEEYSTNEFYDDGSCFCCGPIEEDDEDWY